MKYFECTNCGDGSRCVLRPSKNGRNFDIEDVPKLCNYEQKIRDVIWIEKDDEDEQP